MTDTPRVVVVTGASSGIGRATALAFARDGASVVTVSRDLGRAEAVAQDCRALGGEAFAVSADMADNAAVERLSASAVRQFGHIDVWVSCAAVLLFGRFADIPPKAFARVIETNFIGCVNGSRAALAQFRAQGDRGVLINTSSLLGMTGEPHVSAYVATKFAIRGFTCCLRQEHRDMPNIHICLVMPIAVDTPIYAKAANYFGREARAVLPVLAPERVARRIVAIAKAPRDEALVSAFGHLLGWGCAVAPRLVERLIGRAGPRLQFRSSAREPTDGNLFASTGPQTALGGWRSYWASKLRRLLVS